MDPSQQQYMQQYAANPQYMQQVQMQQYQYAQYAAQQAHAQGYGMPHPQLLSLSWFCFSISTHFIHTS